MSSKFLFLYKAIFLITLLSFAAGKDLRAQEVVEIRDSIDQHIFSFKQIEVLSDTSGKLTFDQIRSKTISQQFKPSKTSTPQTTKLNKVYWFKINIKNNSKAEKYFYWNFSIRHWTMLPLIFHKQMAVIK